MPEGLRTRLRYPQQIFALQAAVFGTFPMTNPAVFYNREDQWEIPSLDTTGTTTEHRTLTPMHPYYTIMKLPGSRAGYIQMLPFTPRGKEQPGGLDGGPQRWCELRQAGGLPVPEADGRLRAQAGRGADQPGPGDLPADHPVESARIRRSSRARCW